MSERPAGPTGAGGVESVAESARPSKSLPDYDYLAASLVDLVHLVRYHGSVITVDVNEAEGRFEELVDRAVNGEDIVITQGGQPVARMVRWEPIPVPEEETL